MAAILPLFAASVLPTQLRTLVCRFSGAVMDSEACCPEDPDGKVTAHAQLLDASCCIVKAVDLDKLISERRAEGAPSTDGALLAATPAPSVRLPLGARMHDRPVGPPPLGPPLILLKRSFLI